LSELAYRVVARSWAERYARGGKPIVRFMASSGDAAGATGASSADVREASGVEIGVAIGLVAETLSIIAGDDS